MKFWTKLVIVDGCSDAVVETKVLVSSPRGQKLQSWSSSWFLSWSKSVGLERKVL